MKILLDVSLLDDTKQPRGNRKNLFFSHCFDVLHGPIFVIAYNILNNRQDAEDYVSEFFEKLMHWPTSRFKGQENLVGYILKAARNHFINAAKAQKSRNGKHAPAEEAFSLEDQTDNVEKKLILKERLGKVQHIIATLPQPQQEALLLKAAGYDHNEIAAKLSINRSASTSRVNRARTYIREKLKMMETDDETSSIAET